MLAPAAIFAISSSLGYLLPAVIGLESMGIPSPGETALVLAAVLASQGKLNIGLVILIGVTSAIIGDNIGYFLGRKVGREVLEAPGPFQHRRKSAIAAGDKFFERHGPKAVFIGRWIALIRVATAWLAGINHMPFRQFFVWNALGGITWGVTFGLAGYFGGQAAASVITRFGAYGAVALAVLFIAAWIALKIRERRAEEPGSQSDPADELAPSPSPDPPDPPRPDATSSARDRDPASRN
jgi:membrane-associated protein